MEPMETFTIDPRRWWMFRVFGRNPLLRRTDRIEVLIIMFAIAVSLSAAAVAGAVGTAVYDARHHLYVREAQSRHAVTATVIDANVERGSGAVVAQVAWPDGRGLHTGPLQSDEPINAGQQFRIWVDNNGSRVDPPTPISRARADAFGIGWGIGSSVVFATVSVVAWAVSRLDRARDAQWERAIECLAADTWRS